MKQHNEFTSQSACVVCMYICRLRQPDNNCASIFLSTTLMLFCFSMFSWKFQFCLLHITHLHTLFVVIYLLYFTLLQLFISALYARMCVCIFFIQFGDFRYFSMFYQKWTSLLLLVLYDCTFNRVASGALK